MIGWRYDVVDMLDKLLMLLLFLTLLELIWSLLFLFKITDYY